MSRLFGQSALVTHATSPQGRAQALLMAREGAHVVLAGALLEDAQELADLIEADGGRATTAVLDPASEPAWADLAATLPKSVGAVDILVNNAIVSTSESFETISQVDWSAGMTEGLESAFLGLRAILPLMMGQRSGVIVNVTSVAAMAAPRGVDEVHAATAGALRTLSKDVSADYAADGVRCNSIHAGVIGDTLGSMSTSLTPEIREELRLVTPMRRAGTFEELAQAVLYLASSESSYVTGTELVVDGGFVGF